MTQPYVDCAVRLARQGVKPEDIKSIVCEVGEGTVHRLWEPLASKQTPPTAYAAKFSSPYCVAAGFIHGDAGLAQFTDAAVRDPRALALAGKVTYVIDPDNEYPANYTGHIRAELTDGRVVEERQGQMRGGAKERMTREDLLAKARANLRFAGRPDGAAEALENFATGLFDDGASFSAAALRQPGA
jgi:2-methylcitrate dehydratase PrpD